jgi:hypothetical protein
MGKRSEVKDAHDAYFTFTTEADLDAQIDAFKQQHQAEHGQRLAVHGKRSLGHGKVQITFRVVAQK